MATANPRAKGGEAVSDERITLITVRVTVAQFDAMHRQAKREGKTVFNWAALQLLRALPDNRKKRKKSKAITKGD